MVVHVEVWREATEEETAAWLAGRVSLLAVETDCGLLVADRLAGAELSLSDPAVLVAAELTLAGE